MNKTITQHLERNRERIKIVNKRIIGINELIAKNAKLIRDIEFANKQIAQAVKDGQLEYNTETYCRYQAIKELTK